MSTRSKALSGLSAKTGGTESLTDDSTEIIETDENLKQMLSVLIQEANFLVEDNLSLLVEEIPADERDLFKLDSILTAIGLQGEEAVYKVLKQHEKNPSKAFDGILKVIRAQIEEKKKEKETSIMSGSNSVSVDKSSKMVSSGGKTDDGKSSVSATVNEWSLVESKLQKFKSEDRMRLLDALKAYNDALTERANLLDKNQKMKRHNNELKMLLNIHRHE